MGDGIGKKVFDDFGKSFDKIKESLDNRNIDFIVAGSNTKPIDERGSWQEKIINLFNNFDSITQTYRQRINISGNILIFSQQGTQFGSLVDIDFGGGNYFKAVRPGTIFKCPFTNFTVIFNNLNNLIGNVPPTATRFLIGLGKDLDYFEQPIAAGSSYMKSRTVSQDSASILNTPVNSTPGVDLDGVTGVKILLESLGGALTGGTLVVWYATTPTLATVGSGQWFESEVQIPVTTVSGAGTRFCSADFVTQIPYGRIFVEARSVTIASGSEVEVTVLARVG